jgi:archaellum component FlaC
MNDTSAKPFNLGTANEAIMINDPRDNTFKPGSETSDEEVEQYKKQFQIDDVLDEDFRAEADEIKNMLAQFNTDLIAIKNRPGDVINELEEIDDTVDEDKRPKTLVDLVMQ